MFNIIRNILISFDKMLHNYINVSFILNNKFFFSFLVTSIQCYQCNSAYNTQCLDVAKWKPHEVAPFLNECNGDYDGAEPFCRTIDLKRMNLLILQFNNFQI